MHHLLNCVENKGCEAERSIRRDDPRRFDCLFQREKRGFFPDVFRDRSAIASHGMYGWVQRVMDEQQDSAAGCVVEREQTDSCVLLKEGVGFSGVCQEHVAILI